MALGSLTQIDHTAAHEVLVLSLNHSYKDVRNISAEFLAKYYKDVRAKPILFDMLASGNTFERVRSAIALSEIWDTEIVSLLIEHLSDKGADKDGQRLCDVAVEALKRIGTPEALEAVERWQREQDERG